MTLSHLDILIVGGGPIGASLALALANSPYRVGLIEARSEPTDDTRTIAISHGTALILQTFNISTNDLDATPINTIHISQKGGFGRTLLRASELELPALGYVISYAKLTNTLQRVLTDTKVSFVTGAKVEDIKSTSGFAVAQIKKTNAIDEVSARLVVLADGGRSAEKIPGIKIVERDYHQFALTALVEISPELTTTAYERFTSVGPLALLPFKNQHALVWTTLAKEAQSLLEMNDTDFLQALSMHAGLQSLRFKTVTSKAIFPLKQRYADPVISQRMALVGNAAQALHPVAGQGFNLGMRDVKMLADCIMSTSRDRVGSKAMLFDYQSSRRWDVSGGLTMTDLLVRGFSNDHPLLRSGRGIGLTALDIFPPVRKWFAKKMMFGISG